MGKRLRGVFALAVVVVLTGVALAACAVPPTVFPAFARGRITAKGSIRVNGFEFDDTTAVISVNGTATGMTEADLKVGMQVNVIGSVDLSDDTGTAAAVEYQSTMVGLVDAVTLLPPTLTVLGQTLLLNSLTTSVASDDPADPLASVSDIVLGGLHGGELVEISAIPDGSGSLLATLVELKVASPGATASCEADGTVANLDVNHRTFQLLPVAGTLDPVIVQYTGPLGARVANGSVVEIAYQKQDYQAASGSSLPLIGSSTAPIAAAAITLKKELGPAVGMFASVEGAITDLSASGTSFRVQGILVDASRVSDLPHLADGTLVAVSGTWFNGVLVASANGLALQ